MRGHETIINMRQRGTAPRIVFINDYPCKTEWQDFREHATVCTFGDGVESLDFRFLVSLKVSISASSEARAKSLFSMAKAAGATLVGASHIKANEPSWAQTGWVEVWGQPEQEIQTKPEAECV